MEEITEKIIVIGEFPPPYGGMAVQAQQLVENLKKDGFTVTALNRESTNKMFGKIRFLRGVINAGILKLKVIAALRKFDIIYVFANSYLSFYLFVIPPILIGKLFGKKVVINYHGGAAEKFINAKIHFAVRWVLKVADNITVPSAYLMEVFKKSGFEAELVNNSIDLRRFKFKQRGVFAPKFIVTRHLEPDYNIETLIKAFRIIADKYKEAKLTICGEGSLRKTLENLVRESGMSGNVEFKGNIPNEELQSTYDDADIFLNSSITDNVPIAIIEAFACGLCVVTTNAGGIIDLVEDGKTGFLVDIYDSKAMAERIERVLSVPALASTITANARETLMKYSWQNVKPEFLQAIRR